MSSLLKLDLSAKCHINNVNPECEDIRDFLRPLNNSTRHRELRVGVGSVDINLRLIAVVSSKRGLSS